MVTYRRVATSDGDAVTPTRSPLSTSSDSNPDDESRRHSSSAPLRSRSERISDKLHALAWVIAAYAVSAYTRLFHTLFEDERINRPIFHASLTLFSINFVLTLYLTAYLPYKFPKLPSATSSAFWDVYCPRVIPTMTACGVLGSILLVRSCYPVWGFLTPLILGIVAMVLCGECSGFEAVHEQLATSMKRPGE